MIELPDDFRDLLIEFHDEGARFVVLGGHAVAFHGHPRTTKDLDVFILADAERVYRALARFGAPLEAFSVSASDFATYDGMLQVGLPPRRIDVLNGRTASPLRRPSPRGRSSSSRGAASR